MHDHSHGHSHAHGVSDRKRLTAALAVTLSIMTVGIIGAAWLAVDRTNNPDPLRDSPAARPGTIN